MKEWVSQLSNVRFIVKEDEKTKLIINLINKFIFIQSLDKFWVIDKNYIGEEWSRIERRWASKDKARILVKFFEEINEYFYELYDTELFRIAEENKTIIDYIDKSQENIDLLYEKTKNILGINYGSDIGSWIPGIIQYNFRRIDEDILGKSYETFLAEIRKEHGIYYTPKYITQYIINNTVEILFNKRIEEISQNLKSGKYENCAHLINNFFSIKILDPACGSGSFLIKVLRLIWSKYNELFNIIDEEYRKYSDFKGKLIRTDEIETIFQKLLNLIQTIGFSDKRTLISKIIVRHIYTETT